MVRRLAGSIFQKLRLHPQQLRTVADRRFADAICLQNSRRNKHANGAMYLGGFVIECLLKAKLMELHPWLQTALYQQEGWSKTEHQIWTLCYRSHNLDDIYAQLGDVRVRLAAAGLDQPLRELCGQWTVRARYSPRQATMREAVKFLATIQEIRPWLK